MYYFCRKFFSDLIYIKYLQEITKKTLKKLFGCEKMDTFALLSGESIQKFS